MDDGPKDGKLIWTAKQNGGEIPANEDVVGSFEIP
jgi:hypothetical protein